MTASVRQELPATLDQNRAGAALTVVATLLGPGQADMNPQCVKERRPWCEIDLFRHAIDMERDRHFGRRRQFFAFFMSR
jgi:hypothetical protein